MLLGSILLILFLGANGKNLPVRDGVCGYDSCHPIKEGVVNVHLVPHTHDDVGWLKTVDQYYFGSNLRMQDARVQYILDSVVDELQKDPNRRFIYVETAFFWKWWLEQTDELREIVKNLVNNGQLEFIGGAWSMNDEATVNYQSTIDQFTYGLRKLNDTFGECGRPKIGWQIDPFGHSREMASIFAQLGYDAFILNRIDYQDRALRSDEIRSEFIWSASESLDLEIFSSIIHNHYSAPGGLCFDVKCGDDPIIDDPNSPEYNVNKFLENILGYAGLVENIYRTGNILVTMGDDFMYSHAHTWFKNIDKLIKYTNEAHNDTLNLIYSTPSCYVKAVQDQTADVKKWTAKTDDFFPYASDEHSYWTGYFTSRPTLKRFERDGNNFLQVCKQLATLSNLERETELSVLQEAVGVLQHHDAITGTEKQHVAFDYARILSNGLDSCQGVVVDALEALVSETPSGLSFDSCLLTNISSCPVSENNSDFVVTVYNPLSRTVSKLISLPVSGQNYTVTDLAGNETRVQLLPIPQEVRNILGRNSSAEVQLNFVAVDLPPLGFKSFVVSETEGDNVVKRSNNNKRNLSAEDIQIVLDPRGLIMQIAFNNVSLSFTQNFYYYVGVNDDNSNADKRASGAYVFRPDSPAREINIYAYEYALYQGEVVSELHQSFLPSDVGPISQIVRINTIENLVEFQWLVGPLVNPNNNESNGVEIVSRFSTVSFNTDGVFYTDSNGRETLRRVRDARPTWDPTIEEPESGNYYPITSKISLQDDEQDIRLTVLTDRAQGGSSLRDGEVELMVHRVCGHDDAFGVGEALNETAFGAGLIVRGSHYLTLGPASNEIVDSDLTQADQNRILEQNKLLQPWIFVSPLDANVTDVSQLKDFSGLTQALPDNVQILTLEPWKDGTILLRLEHIMEKSQNSTLSAPATVSLTGLFTGFDILSVRETTLAANQWLEENKRLVFNKHSKQTTPRKVSDDLDVLLNPMQIRTFVVTVSRK